MRTLIIRWIKLKENLKDNTQKRTDYQLSSTLMKYHSGSTKNLKVLMTLKELIEYLSEIMVEVSIENLNLL